jgi:hypothetical protein
MKMSVIERRRYLWRENAKFKSGVFVPVPRDEWPRNTLDVPMLGVFRSREFLVQVFGGDITRLSVNRTDLNEQGQWRDGISWEELQAVKDGCGFSDCDAVEAYPRKSDVVNVANMRHLWIVPAEYAGFFWRSKPPGDGREQMADGKGGAA